MASTCTLLGSAGAAFADKGDWTIDTGVLYYGEQDRVTAVEPVLLAKRDFGDESWLSTRLVADTLTGATPTGAMPSSTSQTVTSPSGNSQVNVAPGTNPLDNSFKDLRTAISSTWSQPLGREWRFDIGGSYSNEHDFRSLGVNTLISRDFDKRNTTLSAGLAYEADDSFPLGGVHVPLSQVAQPAPPPDDEGGDDEGGGDEGGGGGGDNGQIQSSSATKHVTDALLGVTQVMNRYWIAQLNYSYSVSNGYLNDPYKVVSVLNTHLGAADTLPPGLPGFGPPVGELLYNIYENRPDSRKKQALYLGSKMYLGGDVLDVSLRHGWDDWGIKSDTVEVRYRFAFDDRHYLQPHLRWYTQTAADFYHRGLLDTDTVPQYVSADYRLADFTARTIGIEFGTVLSNGHRISMRLERYIQSGGSDPHVKIGVQQNYDLFPDLQATIVQFSYSF